MSVEFFQYVHGTFPWNPWTFSTVHGDCPGNQWTKSMDNVHGKVPWTMSMEKFHGQCPWNLSRYTVDKIHGHCPLIYSRWLCSVNPEKTFESYCFHAHYGKMHLWLTLTASLGYETFLQFELMFLNLTLRTKRNVSKHGFNVGFYAVIRAVAMIVRFGRH